MLAPAKINLFLRVLAREVSGFHQIETLFAAVDLCDEIHIQRAATPGVTLEVFGADLGPEEENLVYRAALDFLDATSATVGVRIALTKNIPSGAGLGGGSSDAGATLRSINALFGTPLSPQELLGLAAPLGADVPFFASGAGRALGWGRGERLLSLAGCDEVPVLLALPKVKVATPDAYNELTVRTNPVASKRDLIEFDHPERIATIAENDFEPSVFSRHPELGAVRSAMEREGALTARLTGSGAALFALFGERDAAESARDALSTTWTDVRFVVTHTLADQPAPTTAR